MNRSPVFVLCVLAAVLACVPLGAASETKALRLSNPYIDVSVAAHDGTLTVRDKRARRTWEQKSPGKEIVLKNMRRRGAATVELQLQDTVNALNLTASITLPNDKPEIEVVLAGSGPVQKPVAFPQPFVTGKGTVLTVPLSEGILYPVDDEAIQPSQLIAYGGMGMSMPWFGAFDEPSGAGVLAILRTPDDARIDITRQADSGLFIRPLWEASRQQFQYERKITYVFLDKGGYVAQAKRYREYARQTGLFKTLAEKRRENPNVDLLIGAANIWNWDMDEVALCREMKALGMDRILWSKGAKPETIKAINELGFLTSRYDIYQDVWSTDSSKDPKLNLMTEGWPDDLVLLPNGDWMKGWERRRPNAEGVMVVHKGGVICSSRQVARARQRVPEDLKTHPYNCRFIDTTTASPWREDYNPAHPLTRSEDRRYKMALLEFMSKDMKLVTGTETGIDPSVPYVHYYEGMLSMGPYRLPDSGRDMLKYKEPTPKFLKFQVGHFYRVPLWELVYHDCVVSTWYWGDYNNKAPEVWDRRDLFNILYGTPPMYMFPRETWEKDKNRFVESYKNICPLVRKLGYDEMLSHEFLTPDHAVQRTRWRSGAETVVNFGDQPHQLADGRTVKPMSSLVKAN